VHQLTVKKIEKDAKKEEQKEDIHTSNSEHIEEENTHFNGER